MNISKTDYNRLLDDIREVRDISIDTKQKVEGIDKRLEEGNKKFETLDKRVTSLESWKNTVKGWIAGMIGLGTAVASGVSTIINLLIKWKG